MKEFAAGLAITGASIGFFALVICGGVWGCSHTRVYWAENTGRAMLAEAENGRKVQIEDAKGRYEAAKSLAMAEVERAKGVAEANKIIGESLKGNDSYLRYLWIQGLQDKDNNTIYVPTEAGLPILEAGKR